MYSSTTFENGNVSFRVLLIMVLLMRLFSSVFVSFLQQNNLFKAREEKYQSRIRVLEALATGTSDETQVQQGIPVSA